MGLVLGVDVGTSAVKALVLDPASGVCGRGSAEHPTHTIVAGQAEQDPADWWTGTVAAVRQALRDVRASDVTAIAVSGQGAALVALDAHGAPVRPALIHLDQRAHAEAARLADGPVGAAVLAASGNHVGAWNIAAKLTWLREHEGDTTDRAACVTSAAGYVLGRLAGRAVQNTSDAGISDLFDLTGRDWSPAVLDALGLTRQ